MKMGLISKNLLIIGAASIIAAAAAEASQPAVAKNTTVDRKNAEANCAACLVPGTDGVRKTASYYVAEYEQKASIEPLIRVLRTSKVESTRMAAALALVSLGDDKARAAVAEASLYDGSDKVAKFCECLLNAPSKKLSALE